MTGGILELVGPRKVRVSRIGVALFNGQWPGSILDSGRAYWFEFDESGDLIDTDCPEHSDGPESLALCADCKAWLFDNETPGYIPA